MDQAQTFPTGLETLQAVGGIGGELQALLKEESEPRVGRLFSISEAAQLAGCSTSYIRRREELGDIEPLRSAQGHRVFTLDLVNTIRDILGTRPRAPDGKDPLVLAYMNYKGGAGKTTTSIHSAQAFALKGYRVLFVDCDPQASATQAFSLQKDPLDCPSIRYGLVPIDDQEDLFAQHDYTEDLSPLIQSTHWSTIGLIPANPELHDVDYELTSYADLEHNQAPWGRLKKPLINTAKRLGFDLIIMDGQPHLSLLTLACIESADIMLMPARMSGHDIKSTVTFCQKTEHLIKEFINNPRMRYRIPRHIRMLPTQFDGGSVENLNLGVVQSHLAEHMMRTPIAKSEAIKYAGNADALSVFESDKAYPGNRTTAERAKTIITEHIEELEVFFRHLWDVKSIP